MNKEFEALTAWSLVPYNDSQRIVDCKWIFRIKYKPSGAIDRYKARLVAKVFQQDPGINFGDTFSPVARMTTFRLVLAIAVALNWPIKQLYINNAFLNGVLQEEVYMWQPKGFENSKYAHHVCKLNKAIYGLKQSPRTRFQSLRNTLLRWGFSNTKGETSLFIHKTFATVLLILIYVNDILVTGNNTTELNRFTSKLNSMFSLKDLGKVHYFLGLEISRDVTGLFITQKKYVQDLLVKFNMQDATSCPTQW